MIAGTPRPFTRGWDVLDRLLLVLVGTLVPLSCIVAYYVVSYHHLLVNSRWPLGAFQYDATIGYAMRPSFSARLRDGSLYAKTHALGYRIPESADPASVVPGGVLSLGCSFTYGDEVEAEQTFAYLVGERLGLSSYNYGVCAYSYASMALLLQKLATDGVLERLQPKVVLVGVGDWLIERSLHPFMPSEDLQYAYAYIRLADGRLEIAPPPEPFSLLHLFALQEAYFPQGIREVPLTPHRAWLLARELPRVLYANYLGNRERKRLAERYPVATIDLYDFFFRQLESAISGRATRVVILWMATRPEQEMDAGLRGAALRHPTLLLVDGGAALREHHVDPSQYCCGRHPQPQAHAAYADATAARIRNAGLLNPSGSPQSGR